MQWGVWLPLLTGDAFIVTEVSSFSMRQTKITEVARCKWPNSGLWEINIDWVNE